MMGRPTDVPDAVVKTYRISSALLKLLEAAGELREITPSVVVREILERGIDEYLKESLEICAAGEKIQVESLDPESRELFDKCKDRSEYSVPDSIMRNEERLRLFVGAIRAHRTMQEKLGTLRDIMKSRSRNVLEEFAKEKVVPRMIGLIRKLSPLLKSGDAWWQLDARTLVFTISPKASRQVDRRRLEMPGIRQLYKLLEGQELLYTSNDELGWRVYHWKG
jgi:hypothetical protein